MKPSLCRVWYSRMIVLVPLELTEYDYEYNNDPRNTLHAAGPLAHRRGYSGRRLLTQVSPVALVFTTKKGRPATPAPAAALAGAALSFSYFLSTSMGFRLSPFGAPVPFPPWARTLRRVACEICRRRRRRQISRPSRPADGISGF